MFTPSLKELISARWITNDSAEYLVQQLRDDTANLLIIGIGSSGRMILTRALVEAAFPVETRALVLQSSSEKVAGLFKNPDVLLHTVPDDYHDSILDGQYNLAILYDLNVLTLPLWERLVDDRHCSVIAHVSPYSELMAEVLPQRLFATMGPGCVDPGHVHQIRQRIRSRPFIVVSMQNPMQTGHYGVREIGYVQENGEVGDVHHIAWGGVDGDASSFGD